MGIKHEIKRVLQILILSIALGGLFTLILSSQTQLSQPVVVAGVLAGQMFVYILGAYYSYRGIKAIYSHFMGRVKS